MTTESEDPKEIGWNTVEALVIARHVNAGQLDKAANAVARIREEGRRQGLKEAEEKAKVAKNRTPRRSPKTT